MDEFIEEYKDLKVGSKVKVRYEALQVSTMCALHILGSGNVFTIKTIQEFDDGVLIGLEETEDVFEYQDLALIRRKSKHIINWKRAT